MRFFHPIAASFMVRAALLLDSFHIPFFVMVRQLPLLHVNAQQAAASAEAKVHSERCACSFLDTTTMVSNDSVESRIHMTFTKARVHCSC